MARKTILLLCLLASLRGFGQAGGPDPALKSGLDYYRHGRYRQAIMELRNVILDPALSSAHGDAFFWLAKSYFILEQWDDVDRSLESYLLNYPDHHYYAEAFYLKGRLMFSQSDLEGAIQIFQSFISNHPASPYTPNAYFWVGECLYLLGQFDSALKIFQAVLDEFPQSVKVEAAGYRISLIKIKRRETELLKLLKISHEESLRTLEDFQKRKRTYEQAIMAYQRKLSIGESGDYIARIDTLQEQLDAKEKEIARLKARIADLE